MNIILSIMKKELKTYFNSPIAYVVIGVFLLVSGWFVSTNLFIIGVCDLRVFFQIAPLIFMFFAPAITMRLISEERKTGTIELLVTMPIRDSQIIIGKFLAAVILLATALLFTAPFGLILMFLGDIDHGPFIGGYIGLLLMGSAYLAIGVLGSSLTENQVVAFIVGLAISFIFFMFDKISIYIPAFLSSILQYFAIDFHFENIARGVIDSRNVIYYLTLIVVMLSASVAVLEGRKQ
ncbi:MAG: ABC transporter permease [bacterium]|nr:ABC transporter permease [bacterium]